MRRALGIIGAVAAVLGGAYYATEPPVPTTIEKTFTIEVDPQLILGCWHGVLSAEDGGFNAIFIWTGIMQGIGGTKT